MGIKKLKKRVKKIVGRFVDYKNKVALKHVFFHTLGTDIGKRKIAFFTPLPPEQTGTATYAVKLYANIFTELDFISDILSKKAYAKALEFIDQPYQSHIVPLSFYKMRDYEEKVFNFGNSSFHLPYLYEAIATKGEENRHIVLCETQICGLLGAYAKEKGLNLFKLLRNYYPERAELIKEEMPDFWEMLKNANIYGIRALIDLTGIKHFILYRESGSVMLKDDLKGSSLSNEVKVSVLPMCFEKIANQPQKIQLSEGYNIGSFGIASGMKQTDKIINAVNLLNEGGEKVTLWLAGYAVKKYASSFESKHLRIVENASYAQLLELMNSVDLAVQLRKFSLGESSGCISELIALNKNFIAADNLFEPHFAGTGVAVSSQCSVEELAEMIKAELERQTIRDNKKILEVYTFANTALKFAQTVKETENA